MTSDLDIVSKIQSGELSEKKYSVKELEDLISQFKDPKARELVEYGSQVHGYVYHEILPLITLAKHISEKDCKIKHLGPKQEASDGILFHKSLEEGQEKIQLVRAADGYQERLKYEKIKQYGHAEAYGNIEFSGSKHKRVIPKELKLVAYSPSDEGVQNHFKSLIEKALLNKIDKKYTGLSLGIVVDDFIPYRLSSETDLEIVKKLFLETIEENLKSLSHVFKSIYLIGVNSQKVLTYKIV